MSYRTACRLVAEMNLGLWVDRELEDKEDILLEVPRALYSGAHEELFRRIEESRGVAVIVIDTNLHPYWYVRSVCGNELDVLCSHACLDNFFHSWAEHILRMADEERVHLALRDLLCRSRQDGY